MGGEAPQGVVLLLSGLLSFVLANIAHSVQNFTILNFFFPMLNILSLFPLISRRPATNVHFNSDLYDHKKNKKNKIKSQ